MDLFDSENTKLLISALTKPQDEDEMQIFLEALLTSQEIIEIARRMKFSASKTKSMLYRMRGRLRDSLTKEGLL